MPRTDKTGSIVAKTPSRDDTRTSPRGNTRREPEFSKSSLSVQSSDRRILPDPGERQLDSRSNTLTRANGSQDQKRAPTSGEHHHTFANTTVGSGCKVFNGNVGEFNGNNKGHLYDTWTFKDDNDIMSGDSNDREFMKEFFKRPSGTGSVEHHGLGSTDD